MRYQQSDMLISNAMADIQDKVVKKAEFKRVIVNKKEDKNIAKNQNDFLPLMLSVAFAYFAFGAITNVAGAIIPKIRETYSVSSSLSAVLAATFFIAYGFSSIPWGMFMERNGKQKTLVINSIITTLGVVFFASVPGFVPNMLAMFMCGIGITGVQVALNPLVSEISDPAKYSRNLTLFMVINGLGSYAAPQLVTLIKNQGFHWTMTYWVFTAVAVVMTLAVMLPKYPQQVAGDSDDEALALEPDMPSAKAIEKAHGDQDPAGSNKNLTWVLLTENPLIYMYALAIFLYVGVEVGVANTIGFYLEDKLGISSVLGAGAEAAKNTVISNYWGGLLLGRLVSSVFLDKISGKSAIMIYISLASASLYLAMNGDLNQALWAFPAIGFFLSIMFPTIYSLATNSFAKEYSSAVSGILCTAIIGGAVIAPVMASVAEQFQSGDLPSWDTGLLVAFACYIYIFLVGVFAKEQK